MIRRQGLWLFNRLCALTGRLIKPVQAGWRYLPRLWALITGKKAGSHSLYRQDFNALDLGELLRAVNQELPGGKKSETRKQAYYPVPGMVRINGSFLWTGKKCEKGMLQRQKP
jgi:hypothetical protein